MTKLFFASILVSMTCFVFAQGSPNVSNDDNTLLNEYIKSKKTPIITFDTSNIKQFWIDRSVASKNDSFEIILNENNIQGYESIPLKIQLANVNESQDCKIEVFANTEDYRLSILNENNRVISVSSPEDSFIHYSVISSIFHIEDTSNTSFKVLFHSTRNNVLSVKKIILSFADNKNSSFLATPGTLKITHENVNVNSTQITERNQHSFAVTGKRSRVFSTNKIFTSNNNLSSSVSVKNIGNNDTRVYVGFIAYSKNMAPLDGKNYPYKNNKIIKIVESSSGSNKIIVDDYPDWAMNCCLVLDAKEDMSDIPNNKLIDGRISEIKKLENGHAEIILDKPLKTGIPQGTELRVHGQGGSFFYFGSKMIHPGEEFVSNASTHKDDSAFEYSIKAIPRGVYYIVPLILSYSIDQNEDNTILISDFSISY